MSTSIHRNRLATETSLYLRQHAGNPVDWYPWCDEAFDRARREDRPILLSIGYSACHWCHVMERESFEKEEIAALMNELFVCIKVDREERPDIDHVYMKAVQAMTGHGGWPMTIFLTPQGKPFYAGTYFPPADRGAMPGLPKVLVGVARAYADQRGEVISSADRVAAFLNREEGEKPAAQGLGEESVLKAAGSLVGIMDTVHGGFGSAPKFPATTCLTLLMDADRVAPDATRASLIRLALDRMAAGGVYDHVGGGFHRYSVDRMWLVPHFEKMLYDQALLARLYLDAWLYFGEHAYAEVVRGILDYVLREMTSPEGGYYATQDADSEGEEGRFYVWSREAITEILGADDADLFCEIYGVTAGGNFEGRNILFRALSADQLGRCLGVDAAEAEARLAQWRARLYDQRAQRTWPGRDEKILTDWNGLMISSMALAGRVLGRADYVESAARAAGFQRAHVGEEGVRHVFAEGQARVEGFLDDYAFLGRACLDVFEVTGRKEDFVTAEFCARHLLSRFEDGERGGFFFTASSGEPLVARTRDLSDGAVPSGNSVAAELMMRMWVLTADEEYRRAAEGVLSAFGAEALANPYAGAHLLCVAGRYDRGWATVAIVGQRAEARALERAALGSYHPEVGVWCLKEDESASWLPSALAGKRAVKGHPSAYICRGATCSAPIMDPDELAERLADGTLG